MTLDGSEGIGVNIFQGNPILATLAAYALVPVAYFLGVRVFPDKNPADLFGLIFWGVSGLLGFVWLMWLLAWQWDRGWEDDPRTRYGGR